jgi:hypothetical protein
MGDTPGRAFPTISENLTVHVKVTVLVTCAVVIISAALWCYKVESNQSRTNRILSALVQVEMAKLDLSPDMKAKLLEAVNP